MRVYRAGQAALLICPAATLALECRELLSMNPYTPLQGQYLAFIYYYTKINRRPPAEVDLQRYFNVTPPTVHQMIVALERKGLIRRQPGQARSIQVLLSPDQLPPLT